MGTELTLGGGKYYALRDSGLVRFFWTSSRRQVAAFDVKTCLGVAPGNALSLNFGLGEMLLPGDVMLLQDWLMGLSEVPR